jgi:putative ABC transport system ATP-binding protein
MLSGLDQASAGEIWLGKQAIHQQSEKELAILRRKRIGFVFQSAHLVPNLSILENTLLSGFLVSSDKPTVRQRALSLLEKAGLTGLEHRLPKQLSGGQQQRAAIIRALINHPDVLLADEPTGNLNSASSTAILDLLSDFHRSGQTILMVTHDLKTACQGDRILYFRDGTVLAELRFDTESSDYESKEKILSDWLLEKGW